MHSGKLAEVYAPVLYPSSLNGGCSANETYTDIQLKTLSRRIEVFNMKIIMRRDSVIFYPENHRIDNAVRRCLSNRN